MKKSIKDTDKAKFKKHWIGSAILKVLWGKCCFFLFYRKLDSWEGVFIQERRILSGFRTQTTDSKTSALIWHAILLPRLPTLEFSSHPYFSWWCLSPNGVSLRLRSEPHQWALPTALTYEINRLSQKWWCIIFEARLDPLLWRIPADTFWRQSALWKDLHSKQLRPFANSHGSASCWKQVL